MVVSWIWEWDINDIKDYLINKEVVMRDIILKDISNFSNCKFKLCNKITGKTGFEKLMNQKAVLTEKVKNSLSEINQIGSWVSRKQHSSIFILEGIRIYLKPNKVKNPLCIIWNKNIISLLQH